MRVVAKTDVGLIRSQNQDSYASGEVPGGITWAVVCDGMGGAAGGAVASSYVVRTVSERLQSCLRAGMSASSVRNIVMSVVETAGAGLYAMAQNDESLYGMGTTCVLAVVYDDVLFIANVGDSRAYIIENDKLVQLSIDHSIVQHMVDQGQITKEEAMVHPDRNIITRALGVDNRVDVDFFTFDYKSDNTIILCTDGLYGYCSEDEMLSLHKSSSYFEYADKLVNTANSNGGGDNVTVVVLEG